MHLVLCDMMCVRVSVCVRILHLSPPLLLEGDVGGPLMVGACCLTYKEN